MFGRVALVGDAGSSARPHMGFGVAKAGGDAQALADALAAHDDVDAALAAYNAVRQPIGERIMLHGRKLGTHLGVDLKTDEDRRMWKLLQEDDAMMDWIAGAELPGCLPMSVDLPQARLRAQHAPRRPLRSGRPA